VRCNRCGIDQTVRISIIPALTGCRWDCIPIDPNLSHNVRAKLGYRPPFRFVELAQEINNSMPAYVARRVEDLLNRDCKPVRGSSILLLGVTYKPNIADVRESPAAAREVSDRRRRPGRLP
jgi:UDP-N-acetyl-D-mannosaminuronate dehydrogenase